jgi:hypothetical protein
MDVRCLAEILIFLIIKNVYEFRRKFQKIRFKCYNIGRKIEELQTYAQEMVRDKSKFDPNILTEISNWLVSSTYELSQYYESYKNNRPIH